jgi:hypothetical protein
LMTDLRLNRADSRMHFSDLKVLASSAKKYAYAIDHPRKQTPAMRLGSIVDALVFPGFRDFVVFEGTRRGKEWEAFQIRHATREIFSASEYEAAKGAAEAVLSDPIAAPYLVGQHQAVIHFEVEGVPCAAGIENVRGGVDVLGDDFIADLKCTANAEPDYFTRHSFGMLWQAQLAFYGYAVPARNTRRVLIAVEPEPPYEVVVSVMTPALILAGQKTVRMLIEKYKACIASGAWPGYVQSAVELDVPSWAANLEEESGDE